MKTTAKLYFIAFSVCYAANLNAQLSIEGKVENWTNGKAILAYADIMNNNIESWGSIDAKGVLDIQLEYDYMETFKKKASEAQKDAPIGWEMSFKTIGNTFVCSDFEYPLEYINEDAILTGVPELSVMSEDGDTEYGYLYLVSDESIARWLFSYGDDNPSIGYYIRWMYVEHEASVKGFCEMPTYTGNGEEIYNDTTSYDLNFEEGWNMVKYEITEVFNSSSGKVFPVKTKVSVAKFLPDDFQWVIIETN